MSATLRQYAAPHAVDGRFWRLLGLSLLVHGALFVGIGWQHKTLPDPVRPLIASLRLVAASEPAVSVTRPVSQSASESGAVAQPPKPAATLPPQARQQEAAAVLRAAPRVTKPAGPAIVPAQTAPAALPAQPEAAIAEAAVASSAETRRGEAALRPAGDLLAAYRLRLTELFARGIEYPRVAAMRGWEGEVRLRLKVARRGNLLGVALDRSSGFDVLDQHALALLASYGDLPPLPEALEVSEIQVIVPIQYKLRKTT